MEPHSIDPDLLLQILYGSPDGRRFTQDTPVLPDVWAEYARKPGRPVDGLIVPRKSHQAHHVADELYARFRAFRKAHKATGRSKLDVSDMPGLITVSCHFDEVVNVVLPLTRWWDTDGMRDLVKRPERGIRSQAETAFEALRAQSQRGPLATRGLGARRENAGHLGDCFEVREKKESIPDSTARLILALAALHAAQLRGPSAERELRGDWQEPHYLKSLDDFTAPEIGQALVDILKVRVLRKRETMLSEHYAAMTEGASDREREEFRRLVFTLSLNRRGDGAVADSVQTVKADAARRLFALSNGKITWAVIDSGIDASHIAFRDHKRMPDLPEGNPLPRLSAQQSRVERRYNMTLISHLRNRDTLYDDTRRKALARVIAQTIDLPGSRDLQTLRDRVDGLLKKAAQNLRQGRQIDWDLAETLMRVRHEEVPRSHHGTHVAGILGGCWAGGHDGARQQVEGMCPDIRLFDFNVLGGSTQATEFAVVAALRLIRHLNERNDYMMIHGANLSLAIPHDVTNYACGRTPVCVECESAVANGVVVVAAAGNVGYNVFRTKERDVPLHTEASITDPGNAEGVITVGSTHRREPHTYGVSYFSSRGPTGDGRMKPDLVAPGEKINGPICNNEFARLEGTSMAAPHVSGAAALLMARFPELIGQPDRIKQILCSTATDLGRERAYQGAGLVDVLRALQSV